MNGTVRGNTGFRRHLLIIEAVFQAGFQSMAIKYVEPPIALRVR